MDQRDFQLFPLGVGTGQIALSPIPGRLGDYEGDLSKVLQWSPNLVLSMTTQTELDRTGAGDLGADLVAVGVDWIHVPIVDFGTPKDDGDWVTATDRARHVLSQGGKILIHCFGGCGRSGMAALRLMVESGEAPNTALKRLRAVRPCAVETNAQRDWAFIDV